MDANSLEESDLRLLSLVKRGDQAAFSRLMSSHERAVFKYAWALADMPREVEDIVQETFLVLWRRRRTVEIYGLSLLPWLLTTCRFVALNENRRVRARMSRQIDMQQVDELLRPLSADQLSACEELTWVLEYISSLEHPDRELCQLCLIGGLPYADAARKLGISAGAARKRIQRTRETLVRLRAVDDTPR